MTAYSNRKLNGWASLGINVNAIHNFDGNTSLILNLDNIYYKKNQLVNYFASNYDTNYDGYGNRVYDRQQRAGKLHT